MSLILSKHLREISVAAVYLAILLLLAIFRRDYFHKEFFAVWMTLGPLLVTAVGMTWIIIARQIDISIGSQFSVCAVLAGVAAQMHLPMPVVASIAILAGALFGAANGFLVAFLELPSIVVTLAMMVFLREGLSLAREGATVNRIPDYFQWFGAGQSVGQWIILLVPLAVFGCFVFASRYLSGGRAVYAVGSDFEAARLAGLRPRHVTFAVFVLMGMLTGLAALLNAVRLPDVGVNTGAGDELKVIAAVVVGGTAISGGKGTMLGTLLGIVLLGTISSALVFFKIPTSWEKAVQGAVILAAVASDAFAGKRAA